VPFKKSETQGLKPSAVTSGTARLKSCPDTKHECRGSSGCGWAAKLMFSPGLKARSLLDRAFRGFENPLPRTEVRGWHSSMKVRVYPTASFQRCGEVVRGWHGLATDWQRQKHRAIKSCPYKEPNRRFLMAKRERPAPRSGRQRRRIAIRQPRRLRCGLGWESRPAHIAGPAL
jgi:hypothetical protein